MRFFQFIENNYAPWIFQNRARERAADFVSWTPWWRADESENIVGMFVLIHPKDDRLRLGIERLSNQLAEKSFSGASGPDQKKRAERSSRRGQRKIRLQVGQDGIDRFILAAQIFLQPGCVGI